MSYLAIEQLENEVEVIQPIRIPKSMNIEAIRLKLYKHDVLVDGIVSIGIYDGLNLLGELSLSYQELNTLGTYFYGMVRFTPMKNIALRKDPSATYLQLDLKVTISGHTNSENAYIGLIKDPDPTVDTYHPENNPYSPNPELDIWFQPYGIEIYTV